MPKLDDLAMRPDLQMGPMLVSPSRRLVEGPGGQANLEPLIMQAFLILIDAGGRVVTRSELFEQCWGGAIVGDDSLNRAIAKVRRTGSKVAPGLFEIETIPRTGYRLTGDILDHLDGSAGKDLRRADLSRRTVIAAGAGASAMGAAGLWWLSSDRGDPRFHALVRRGEEALRLDESGAERYFRQAVAIESENARAWGLLSYALAGGVFGPSTISGETAQSAEDAARTALAIDPRTSDALLARALIRSGTQDRLSTERDYRRVLEVDPENTRAMRHLGQFLHGVGRCRDAYAMVERSLEIEPLSPDQRARRAIQMWVLGRDAEADRVIDRALQFWPDHYLTRLGRFMIYAYTGRVPAARSMVEAEESRPVIMSAPATRVWRASLRALENPTPESIAAARTANLEGSQGSPQVAAWAILTLSKLGELDSAFAVANGFLLDRGSVIVRPRTDHPPSRINNPGWRNTFGLFTPPTRAMRLDPRFRSLADGLGLTDYWKRTSGPDDFLFRA